MPHLTLNGRQVYIEDADPHDAPVLLYLHGGPGTGCYDFMNHQKDRLGQHLRVIALDQRGVLRSEPLAEDERLTLDDLLSDLEALRRHLHIERWSVLGHSFGGYLALLYALTYPQSVERLLFENPTFDFHLSVRSLLSAAADVFSTSGQEELAAQCHQAVAAPAFTDALMQSFFQLMSALGDRHTSLYEHRAEAKLFDTLVENSGLPTENWQRAQRHSVQIFAEGRFIHESLLPRLSEIACPGLLLQGAHDSVTSTEQSAAFRESVANGTFQMFPHSSHFIHLEEPDAFAEAVLAFLDANNGVYGWMITHKRTRETLSSHNTAEWFPLASSAKLAIGALVAAAVRSQEFSWDMVLDDVHFDPKEDSHLLYPHLQGRNSQQLCDVVEVMIACHDHQCAAACAELLGGWERVQARMNEWIPHISIDANPRDEERNAARLDALQTLLHTVSDGYREQPAIWQPIFAGLVRQQDKNERIPQHEIYNLTGGLPTAAIDLGLLGTLHNQEHLLYIVAGKHLTNRASADAKLTDILHQQYLNTKTS